jgi:hypothetical protein
MTDMTIEQPQKKAWIEQIYRWFVSTYPLNLVYGKHNIKMLVNHGFPYFVLTHPITFWKLVMADEKINLYTVITKIKLMIIAFFISQKVQINSHKKYDVLQGSEAKAFW